MSGPGGGIRITIGGSAEQLQMAAQQGASALGELAAAYRQQAEIINATAEAYRVLGAAAAESTEAILRDAAGTEEYDAALAAVRAQLSMVVASQNEANASMADFDGLVSRLQGMNGPVHGLGNLLGGFSPMLHDISAGTANFGSIAEDVSMGGLSLLSGGFGALTSSIGGFLQQAFAMTAGMMIFQGFAWATQQVQNLAGEMMNLNETMQSQDVGWAYLFGGAGFGPGGSAGPNYGAASQLLQWTAVQSYNAPFTRQDIDQAISTLQTVGLDQAGIERYLPVLEDLAVRNPGLSLAQIAQSVMGAEFGYTRMLRYDLRIAPQELEKYGLNMADGVRIDPSTLLPALLNYATAQGYYNPTGPGGMDEGAAFMLAHDTFQGAWTSFQDRYQNELLELGGTAWQDAQNPLYDATAKSHTGNAVSADAANKQIADLYTMIDQDLKDGNQQKAASDKEQLRELLQTFGGGVTVRNPEYNALSSDPMQQQEYIQKAFTQAGDIRQGSLFDMMINGLNAITTWWDEHQQELDKLADLISSGLGAAFQMAGKAAEGFFEGLSKSGLGKDVLDMIQNAVAWLTDPEHQRKVEDLASAIGTGLGIALQTAGQDLSLMVTEFLRFVDAVEGNNTDIIDFFYQMEVNWAVFNYMIEAAIIMASTLGRILVDVAKAFYYSTSGDYIDAAKAYLDIGLAIVEEQNAGNTAWQQTLQLIGEATAAQAAYDKSRQAQPAAPNAPHATPPPGHATGGAAGGVHGNSAAVGAGSGSAWSGGGSGTTYGATTINNFIYGADSRTVQAIVDQSKERQAVNGSLVAQRPGIGRLRMVGLVY